LNFSNSDLNCALHVDDVQRHLVCFRFNKIVTINATLSNLLSSDSGVQSGTEQE